MGNGLQWHTIDRQYLIPQPRRGLRGGGGGGGGEKEEGGGEMGRGEGGGAKEGEHSKWLEQAKDTM